MNIRVIAVIFLPMVLTMLIPLFMIKERSTLDEDVAAYAKEEGYEAEETVGIWESLKYAIKNKSFIVWMGVYFALQFSTQLFLNGQNVIYSGYVRLEGFQITMVMACAFAPVPLTLLLYNRLVRKHGIRVGYIFSLAAYMAAMLVLIFSSKELIPNDTVRIIFACFGGLLSSFGTGCFFSINYTIPSTLAAIEKKETGISHPAMYFAIQGLTGALATALSTGLIWVNLKAHGLVWLAPFVVIAGSIVSMVATKFMNKQVCNIGKAQTEEDAE
jgi:Na+/melibiose symporter-like transporter